MSRRSISGRVLATGRMDSAHQIHFLQATLGDRNFADAVREQEAAIEALKALDLTAGELNDFLPQFEDRLALFKQNKPYRE